MPHDLRIAPIRLPERIGESGSGRNLRQRRERRCEQAREEHRAGREQRLQKMGGELQVAVVGNCTGRKSKTSEAR